MPTRSIHIRMDDQKKKTTLIQKELLKGTRPNNYTPITCLRMMLKILTAEIREEIYNSLTSHILLTEEQKECRKRSRRTGVLLYIDQHTINESKTSWENIAIPWIGYKNAYEIVTQSWIIKSLIMYKISHELINCIQKTMKTWKVELTARRSLAEAKD